MISDDNQTTHGVYKLQMRWDLIWIIDVETNKEETIKQDKLNELLCKSFNSDILEKIFDYLCEGDKFLIDFDNKKIKLIKSKEKPFENFMSSYFTTENIQNEINNGFDPFEIYKKEGIEWLN